jgi:exodeoxyribonuclease V gamma subunit
VLKKSFDHAIYQADKEGKLPLGMFKTVAKKRFKEEMEDLEQKLLKHGISFKDLFQIEFCTSCSEPFQVQEDHWLLPALKIQNGDHQISIVGTLPYVSQQGLIILSQGSGFSDAWKAWPQFLLFDYATSFNFRPMEKNLILSKSTLAKKAFFEQGSLYLRKLIDYYTFALKNFSPLLPEWIPFIVAGDEKGIQDLMKHSFSNPFGALSNQELKWILNKDHLPCPKILLENWQEIGQQLAGDLLWFWYPSKKFKEGEE